MALGGRACSWSVAARRHPYCQTTTITLSEATYGPASRTPIDLYKHISLHHLSTTVDDSQLHLCIDVGSALRLRA